MENSTKQEYPSNVLAIIHDFVLGYDARNLDLRQPHLRPSVAKIYLFIVFMYSVLVVSGTCSNLAVLYHILRHKLQRSDGIYVLLLNNVVSDIVKCVFVVPLSLYVLLVQNWILGEHLCQCLPMFQDIPLHTTTLTFLLIAWDRLRYIRHPTKHRIPALVCAVGTWLTSVCLVLPYPLYVMYIDLGKYVPSYQGVGICIVNLADDMKEYMRGIFLIMYAGPFATISYLYVRVSRELQTQQTSLAVVVFEPRGRSRTDSHSTTDYRPSRAESDICSQNSRSSYRDRLHQRHHIIDDNDLDIPKEKRTQKYLFSMVTVYAVCLCPLMILRLARLALLETYDNAGHFDITYTMFVWVAFVPTVTTPILFACWQMSRCAKDRLRGYFRFSNRKLRQSCETVISTTGTPATARAVHLNKGHNISDDMQSDDTNSRETTYGYQQEMSSS